VEYLDPCDITGFVATNTPAERAGVRVGDRVTGINGKRIVNGEMFLRAVKENGVKPLALTVLRDGADVTMEMTPEFDPQIKRVLIGTLFKMTLIPAWMAHSDPIAQVSWDAGSVYRVLDGLVAPKAEGERGEVASNIGGPLTLLQWLWISVTGGIWICLGLVRMICINLAIINLLPVPVLDGGHILFALWEMITRRKPHPKVVEVLVNVFAVLLIGLMLLLVFKDSLRMGREALDKRAKTKQFEQIVAPENADETEAVAP
jgi:regulator of sigma E protease